MNPVDSRKRIWTTAAAAFGGLAVMTVIIYFVKGELNLGTLLGGAVGLSIFVFFNLRRLARKKDATPEVDERIKENMNKFRSAVGSIFLLFIALTLIVLFFFDINTIDVSCIWIALLLYIVVMGIGGAIVKKR